MPLVASSGCLACHRLGEQGNGGPGADLTHVGARLPRAAIEASLVHPQPPMPSFADLPRADREAISSFLADLR
jgi:menaquinol-cytochrome c reductase cytochrome b/c subunit